MTGNRRREKKTYDSLPVVCLFSGVPGVLAGGVVHEGEPQQAPAQAQAPRDVEGSVPAVPVDDEATKRQGEGYTQGRCLQAGEYKG